MRPTRCSCSRSPGRLTVVHCFTDPDTCLLLGGTGQLTASETRDFWIQGERAEFGGEFVMTAGRPRVRPADAEPLSLRIRTSIVRMGFYGRAMAIARYPSFVIDCPDAAALATFYGTMLDWTVKTSDGWGEIRDTETGNCICFQQVEGFTRPHWPEQVVPQQMHLDVMVDDLDAGEEAVVALGATKHEHQPGESFRVFLDPAGHPFCLCVD